MPPPQIPRVEELEYWSTGEKKHIGSMTAPSPRPFKNSNSMEFVSVPADLYEKLIAQRGNGNKEAAPPRKFANAGPVGLLGLFITTFAFSCVELGIGGSTTLAGLTGSLFFTGPVLLLFAAFSDWLSGNFFGFLVDAAMGVFWLSLGILFIPSLNIISSYSDTNSFTDGGNSPGLNASIGLYLIAWGLITMVLLIVSIKTNLVTLVLFAILDAAFFIFAASHLQLAAANGNIALILQKVGGGCTFVVALLLFYEFIDGMFAEMNMGIRLPMGDLNQMQMKPVVPGEPIFDAKNYYRHDEESQMPYNSRVVMQR